MAETWRFSELTPEDAAAVSSWRYGGRHAFYDTAADPDFAAAFSDPTLWRLRDLERERDVVLAVKDAGGCSPDSSRSGGHQACAGSGSAWRRD